MVPTTWFAVVLNWNLALDTAECIRSMERAGLPLQQMVLVDNGSTDDSLEYLHRTLDDCITYASLKENLGFAGGTNVGIRTALDMGAEWLLLINNDTLVSPSFFRYLAKAVEERPSWRLISPLILYADEPEIIWSMGDRRIGGTLLTRPILRDRRVPDDLTTYLEADSLNACGLLVHRDVFNRIGLFDLTYFMYAEDADFCWRAQQAEFQLGIATQARMWHKVSRSTGVHHPQSRYWRIRNQILFYRKHGRNIQVPLLFLFTVLRTILMAGRDVFAGRFGLIRTNWQGWFDGWRTDLAPYPTSYR